MILASIIVSYIFTWVGYLHGPFFDIHLAISSIHDKFSFQFRFRAHFFAFQNTDTRLKIFPTALKKFALRAENETFLKYHIFLRSDLILIKYLAQIRADEIFGAHSLTDGDLELRYLK